MSAPTQIKSSGHVTTVIKVAGNEIPGKYQLYSLTVNHTVNRIGSAAITFRDGDAAKSTFAVSSADDFVPGKEITIEAGYASKTEVIFKGLITRQSAKVKPPQGVAAGVECQGQGL